MKQFTATELHAAPAEVCEQAYRGPVEIFKNRRRKFVILAASDYDELVEKARSVPDQQPSDSHA
ncbi:type II toxin-antitoxin system prevent-host-death family antitoxin [Rhizobium wenxiniae]|uniref:type II toxin-antitoxin system prevent-host-death family antitoxin n=1 Tax=Rhizobium wenxiniae TaxID=1737357 RepID=UPI003C15BF31